MGKQCTSEKQTVSEKIWLRKLLKATQLREMKYQRCEFNTLQALQHTKVTVSLHEQGTHKSVLA